MTFGREIMAPLLYCMVINPNVLDFTFNGWGHKFESDSDNKITYNLTNTLFKGHRIVKKHSSQKVDP